MWKDALKIDTIPILEITDSTFLKYGRLLGDFNFKEVDAYMKQNTLLPQMGNIYLPSVEEMEKMKLANSIKFSIYGGMDIQIGYCNGNNSNLNGLEYHKGSEVNYAVSDLVLMLGHLRDIENNHYDSDKIEAFFIPKGKAIEIYQTTLHFAPCKVREEGFKCVVILPKGTNTPLDKEERRRTAKPIENQMLFMKNKWLIAHPGNANLVAKGAFIGIRGRNHSLQISG